MSQRLPDTATRPVDDRPIVIARERPSVLGGILQGLTILLLLAILGAVVMVMFTLASLLNVPGQVAGGVGSRLGGAVDEVARAASSAQQTLQTITDPQHPPVGLTYDNEFRALQVVAIGEHLPGGTDYVFSLSGIKRRPPATSPDTAQYAVFHAERRQPNETRLLGQVIRSDADPHDYATYKGESFRIGRTVYRVNWVSEAESGVAIAAYRAPDTISVALKFDYP